MRTQPPSTDEYADLNAQMLYRACPMPEETPFFMLHMGVAIHLGLTWVESLNYVIERRDATVN